MKIFGSVYPFVEGGDPSLRLGRHVANYEFLKALLTEGSFDEYHLFCLSTGHLQTTAERIRSESIPDSAKRKVRLFLIHHLIDNLRCNRYHVFHLGGWGYFFPGLVYLRNKHAIHKFPITGLIHSLNGIETSFHGLKLCTAPVLPYDTIVCSSEAGRLVLENSLRRLGEGMARKGARIAFSGRTETIPLGVDAAFVRPAPSDMCRRKLGITETAAVLLSVGRMAPGTKGDPYPLLQCFHMLRDRCPDREMWLVLAGGATGSDRKLMEGMVAELNIGQAVKLLPNFDLSLKPVLFSAADVFVALSDNLQETFGISVIEAMAAGVPVVASDLNGYKELFDHGVEGYKVPTTWIDELELCELADIMNFGTMQLGLAQCMAVDTEATVGYLEQLLGDTEAAKRMGLAGRKRVELRYRWPEVIGCYERLWDRLAEEADGYRGEVGVEENLFSNDYLASFRHYPTAILDGEHGCELTDLGRRSLATGKLPVPYSDVAVLADPRVVKSLLAAVASGARTVRELLADPVLGAAAGGDRMRYAVLWAAKYFLIRLVAPS